MLLCWGHTVRVAEEMLLRGARRGDGRTDGQTGHLRENTTYGDFPSWRRAPGNGAVTGDRRESNSLAPASPFPTSTRRFVLVWVWFSSPHPSQFGGVLIRKQTGSGADGSEQNLPLNAPKTDFLGSHCADFCPKSSFENT